MDNLTEFKTLVDYEAAKYDILYPNVSRIIDEDSYKFEKKKPLPPNGVFILDTDGGLTTSDKWNTGNNSKAVGVAVITDKCKFVIAPEDVGSTLKWGGFDKTITGIVTTEDENTALQDFAGESNTDKIIATLKNTTDSEGIVGAPAAEYCRSYKFKHNKFGYLGSVGEWQAAYDNKAAVDACMSKINGTAIYSDYYWASTQLASYHAWGLLWSDGYVTTDLKYSGNSARAFAALDI